MLLKFVHIEMLVAETFRFIESDAIDDGGVVEGIADNGVFGSKDSLEEACVGVEATGEQNAIFNFVVIGDCLLKLLVNILGAANEPHRTHPKAMGVKSLLSRIDKPGVVGESQIVVGTKVENRFVVGGDLGGLGTGDDTLSLVGAGFPDCLDLLGEDCLDLFLHRIDLMIDIVSIIRRRTAYISIRSSSGFLRWGRTCA